jgi:hypothetical protein
MFSLEEPVIKPLDLQGGVQADEGGETPVFPMF